MNKESSRQGRESNRGSSTIRNVNVPDYSRKGGRKQPQSQGRHNP